MTKEIDIVWRRAQGPVIKEIEKGDWVRVISGDAELRKHRVQQEIRTLDWYKVAAVFQAAAGDRRYRLDVPPPEDVGSWKVGSWKGTGPWVHEHHVIREDPPTMDLYERRIEERRTAEIARIRKAEAEAKLTPPGSRLVPIQGQPGLFVEVDENHCVRRLHEFRRLHEPATPVLTVTVPADPPTPDSIERCFRCGGPAYVGFLERECLAEKASGVCEPPKLPEPDPKTLKTAWRQPDGTWVLGGSVHSDPPCGYSEPAYRFAGVKTWSPSYLHAVEAWRERQAFEKRAEEHLRAQEAAALPLAGKTKILSSSGVPAIVHGALKGSPSGVR